MRGLLFSIVIFFCQLAYAEDSSTHPLAGTSWKVVSTENVLGNEGIYGTMDFTGQQFHFLSANDLAFVQADRLFAVAYEGDSETISYEHTTLTYTLSGDTLRLTFVDDTTERHLRLSLVPHPPLPASAVAAVETYQASLSTRTEGILFNGVYHYAYDYKGKSRHRYLRFLPDYSLLYRSSVMGPAQLLSTSELNANQRTALQIEVDDQGVLLNAVYTDTIYSRGPDAEPTQIKSYSYYPTPDGQLRAVEETQTYPGHLRYDGNTVQVEEVETNYTFMPHDNPIYVEDVTTIGIVPDMEVPHSEFLLSGKQGVEVFKVVETMPRFPGCEEIAAMSERKKCSQMALLKYIYSNVKYPADAKAAGEQGTTVITFVVEKDGSLTDIRCVRSVYPSIDAEGIRVVQQMAAEGVKWIPGAQRGKAVRVQFNLPIKFKLEGQSRRPRRGRN